MFTQKIQKWESVYINSNQKSTNQADITVPINLTEYTHVVVSSSEIPMTFFAIRHGRDTFEVSEDNGATYVEIHLHHGSYTISALVTELQNLFDQLLTFHYTVSFNTDPSTYQTGKITWNVSGNNGVQPLFNFFIDADELFYEVLGFNDDPSIIEYSFNNNTLTSPTVINLTCASNVLIHSDIVKPTLNNGNILEVISISNAQSFSYADFLQFLIVNSREISNPSAGTIRLYLTDDDNIPIDLGGVAWNIKLILLKMVDYTDFEQRMIDFVKYYVAKKE